MTSRSSQSALSSQPGFNNLGADLQQLLKRFSLREWRVRNKRLNRAVEDSGSLFVFPEETSRHSRAFAFDPVPFPVSPGEWQQLRSGVLQRARVMNALLKDLYGERNIIESGILPPEWILDDPAFELEYSGLCGQEDPALLGAVDLIRSESGEWMISDHHFSVAEGLSHLIQGRRLLAQYFPEYANGLAVEPVSSFPSRISENLRLGSGATFGNGGDPLAVMLSHSERKEIFLEESFLARQMGMPVVMSTDLVVRDFQVYFKTIHGLQKVSVIFRRVQSEGLDPVAVNRSELAGVPGLIHCLRAGTVRMVNAPGTGVADNRALLRCGGQLSHFYLREKSILKDLPTLVSYDPDQALEFQENPDQWWIRPLWKPHLLSRWAALHAGLSPRYPQVAHPRQKLDEVQIWSGTRFEPRVYSLRVFFVLGQEPMVLPGGWLRLTKGVPLDQSEGDWDFTQDVSVGIDGGQPSLPRQRLEQSLDIVEIPPGSTLAESMYWLGRYLERADCGARMVSILAEESFAQTREDNWISWETFIAAVGENSRQVFDPWRSEPDRFAALMLFRSDLSPSVWTCLDMARRMADNTLGNLSPEFSQVLGELRQRLRVFVARKRLTPPERRSSCLDVMQTVACLFGTADRTLLLDESWRLMCIGALLERAILTVNMLSRALPLAARHQGRHRIDDSELVYLLRMTGTLDAYHRIYRSRAFIDRVARLLWQHPRAPRSVQYCLNEVLRHLQALSAIGGSLPKLASERVQRLSERVQAFPVARMFPARSLELDWGQGQEFEALAGSDDAIEEASQHLRSEIEAIHHQLEADFFNHEAHTPLGRIKTDAF